MGKLSKRVAIVTGGAGGLGQAIAERLATEGADIAVADLKSTEETGRLVEMQGRRFLGVHCDVSEPADVHELAELTEATLGPADILVNNAVVAGKISFEDVSFEEWKRFFSVNIHGYFLTTRALLKQLKRSAAGRVINMSSISYWGNTPQLVPYITTKGAINGFTNSLATELGQYAITVNSISPSMVRTPALLGIANIEESLAKLVQMQVIKREQSPGDVAAVAAFLASDDAAFMTGQNVVVDGGMTRR